MTIFPFGGVVYLVIEGCIRFVNSGYFRFDKVWILVIVEKHSASFGELELQNLVKKKWQVVWESWTLVLEDNAPNGNTQS
jgi:hypothetical protein